MLSDPNHKTKKADTATVAGARAAADKRERTIRLHGLPEGTQEGLLQQALEKIAPVQRVEVFAKSHEAIAELASQAVRLSAATMLTPRTSGQSCSAQNRSSSTAPQSHSASKRGEPSRRSQARRRPRCRLPHAQRGEVVRSLGRRGQWLKPPSQRRQNPPAIKTFTAISSRRRMRSARLKGRIAPR